MHVTITHFEDSTNNQTGEIITMYWINIQYSTRGAYSLSKRYSDFATLYQILKDYLPNDYKFPNKSMFHNNAQFTKERRMKGFDELLKYLSRHLPLNPEYQAFLEIKSHISAPEREEIIEQMKTQSLENSTRTTTSPMSTGPSTSGISRRAQIKSISLKSKINSQSETTEEITIRRKLSQLSNFLLHKATDPDDNLTMYEIMMKEKDNNFRYHFHTGISNYLMSSMKISSAIYMISILLGIIDFSYVNYSKTFYIFTSLMMIFLFFEVKKIRFDLLKKSSTNSKNNNHHQKKGKKIDDQGDSENDDDDDGREDHKNGNPKKKRQKSITKGSVLASFNEEEEDEEQVEQNGMKNTKGSSSAAGSQSNQTEDIGQRNSSESSNNSLSRRKQVKIVE